MLFVINPLYCDAKNKIKNTTEHPSVLRIIIRPPSSALRELPLLKQAIFGSWYVSQISQTLGRSSYTIEWHKLYASHSVGTAVTGKMSAFHDTLCSSRMNDKELFGVAFIENFLLYLSFTS